MNAHFKKNKSYAISAEVGKQRGIAVIHSELSSTGILDIIGGACFLFPFIGLASKGAWQLTPEYIYIDVE